MYKRTINYLGKSMPNVDEETLKNLTKLSRIRCSEEEEGALLKDLKNILNYVEQMQEVDTQHVPPCYQVLDDMANVMREDKAGPSLPREIFLANAPSQIGGMIKVPTVIKQS